MELNKAVLDCMQALRRRIRDELSVDIRLSQPDAVEAMLMACLRSSDQETRNLGIRLAEMSDFQSPAKASEPSVPAQQYRGHVRSIDNIAPVAAAAPVTHEEEAPRGSVRMYRGQRVYA
jgi:hypothetical protein